MNKLQVGQHYQQPDNDYCGTIISLFTFKQEFGTYQLIYYQVGDDRAPTCDVYRLSDAGDVLLGFVTPLVTIWWCYILYPEDDWGLEWFYTSDLGIARLLDKSEKELEEHFNQLYEIV